MQILTRNPACLALAASILLSAGNAGAQDCRLDWDWTSRSQIPVRIHPDLAENLLRADDTPWTDDEIRREIEYVVETLQEQLPSGAPPFVVKGFSSGKDWDDAIGGAVHVVPWLGDCDGGGCGCEATAWITDRKPSKGIRLVLKRSQDGRKRDRPLGLNDCDIRWEHFAPNTRPERSIRGILNHEMMHVYGFNHYNDPEACRFRWACGDTPCSCLDGNEGDQADVDNCYAWDQWNVRALYGPWKKPEKRHQLQSLDGLSWHDVETMPETAPLFGVSTADSPFAIVNAKDPEELFQQLHRFTDSTEDYDFWGTLQSSVAMGRVGSAHDLTDSFQLYGAWAGPEHFDEVRKPIRLLEVNKIFQPSIVSFGEGVTRMQGVTAAHDPKKDFIVLAWRDSNAHVAVQFFDGEKLEDPWILTGQLSGDSPACLLYTSDAADE